jgi:superfamily II DNA or RNA helicase
VETSAGLGTRVRLACLDDDAQGDILEVIWEIEPDARVLSDDAWQTIGRKGFDSKRWFSAYVHTLRWNCVTATDPRLFQSPFRAGIKLDAYQLEPLRKALLLPRVNLFIADDVGLGKTIEAGLITSELILRRRVRDIVIACPPSMIPQWQDEMETRFGLVFEVLDREYVERARREHGYATNPWTTFPRFLVSHALLVDENYAGPLRAWLGSFHAGGLLILDEAHHAAPSSGAKYAIDSRTTRAIRDLAPHFEHRLFLSATPHNGHSNSFSALLELLDPQRFTRGVKVLARSRDEVMVRRLKEDIRNIQGGFPIRHVKQVDLPGDLGRLALPPDAPELRLSELLDKYREVRRCRLASATRKQQSQGSLLISGLQQRLLSSIEAFARTLAVHRRTMERVWQGEAARVGHVDVAVLAGSPDPDDDRSLLDDEEIGAVEEAAFRAATLASAGPSEGGPEAERVLLDEMARIADRARGLPDCRVEYLMQWIREHMCAGASLPGERQATPGAPWTDVRAIIFTEYEDTRRWLMGLLRAAIANTDRAAERIEVYSGSTPRERRRAIQRAFNMNPQQHPVRILIATDAAREGLNLQAHCRHLFHLDVPWNPSRLEQRNGRIDRKLQPAPEVTCHYFVYTQRTEDRVLRTLVRKTETIRRELGSLSQVLEARLAEMLQQGGIRHAEAERIEAEIEAAAPDADKQQVVEEELEAVRERERAVEEQLDRLRTMLATSQRRMGLEDAALRDALSCSLEMLEVEPLQPAATPDGQPDRYVFPNLDTRRGADPTWADTLDTLRELPEQGERGFAWRSESPIRPVVFRAPDQIDDDVVQLHLSHRVVQRLLSRFTAQGFVYNDLSRACLAQTDDAIPRVVLLGRLALYGKGAARLHEEILTVTARWVAPDARKGPLAAYARDAEAHTLDLLEKAMAPGGAAVPDAIAKRLLAAVEQDISDLRPQLDARGSEAQTMAARRLAERGEAEARAMREILETQRQRVEQQAARAQQVLPGTLPPDEERQLQADRRAWARFIASFERDREAEPKRIGDFYTVASARIEPVGLAYLWPVSG